jgi:hypothetical protein
MMFDFVYVTPEKAFEKDLLKGKSLAHYQALNRNKQTCCNCENAVWKLVDTQMCFSCTTGETDASDDYELR